MTMDLLGLREAAGYDSRRPLAEALGLSVQRFYNWEHAADRPTRMGFDRARSLAKALGVDMETLYEACEETERRYRRG